MRSWLYHIIVDSDIWQKTMVHSMIPSYEVHKCTSFKPQYIPERCHHEGMLQHFRQQHILTIWVPHTSSVWVLKKHFQNCVPLLIMRPLQNNRKFSRSELKRVNSMRGHMHICKKWAPLISKATPINQCVKISVQICFTNCEDTWVKMGWKVHLCWQLLCKHYMNLTYKFSSVQIKQVQKVYSTSQLICHGLHSHEFGHTEQHKNKFLCFHYF